MFKLPMTHAKGLILFTGLMAVSGVSSAGKNDFKELIEVKSVHQSGDGKSKISIFRDDVQITQGSLNISADVVEVTVLEDGKQEFVIRGTPAVYSQTLDDGGEIQAKANVMEYSVATRILSLTGNAELHQNSSSVSGNKIVYNMEEERLAAEGLSDENGRVTTIFQPSPQASKTDNEDVQNVNEPAQEVQP